MRRRELIAGTFAVAAWGQNVLAGLLASAAPCVEFVGAKSFPVERDAQCAVRASSLVSIP